MVTQEALYMSSKVLKIILIYFIHDYDLWFIISHIMFNLGKLHALKLNIPFSMFQMFLIIPIILIAFLYYAYFTYIFPKCRVRHSRWSYLWLELGFACSSSLVSPHGLEDRFFSLVSFMYFPFLDMLYGLFHSRL